jgi:hypothetical protein
VQPFESARPGVGEDTKKRIMVKINIFDEEAAVAHRE